MGGKYQVYSEYKDSGHRFVGEIPGRWTRRIVGSLSDVIDPQPDHRAPAICNDGQGFPYIGIRDVNKDGTLNFETARPVEESAVIKQEVSFTIEPNNIVFCKVGTLGIPRIVVPHGRCALSATLVLIKVNKDFNSQYMLYALASNVVTSQTNYLATGSTRAALGIQQIRKFQIPVPPLDQQEKIANFLDHETAKIDTLIEKQQQLIKLLKEKRQSVISHAVTKGLNPNAPMRDSGVEWLGEVPEHWATLPLKLVVKTRKGVAFKSVDFCDNGIRVVKASDIKEKTIRATDVFLPQAFVKEYPKALLNSGDIILSTVGSNPDVRNSAVGQIGIVPADLYGTLLNQNTVVFDPNEGRVLREYLFYILQMEGYRDHLDLHAHGTANQSSLSIADMLNFNICFPPIAEQREICQHLLQQQKKLGDLESKSGNSGILLTERRTALISAAVTGKIDVRNWQAPETSNTNYKEVAA